MVPTPKLSTIIITSQEGHRLSQHIPFSSGHLDGPFFPPCKVPFSTVVFNTSPQILPRLEELRVDKTWRKSCGTFLPEIRELDLGLQLGKSFYRLQIWGNKA